MLMILYVLSDDEKDMVNEIFTKYHVKLYNVSFQILHSQHDTEDALAQTLLKIMDHIDRIKKIPCHEILPFCVIVSRNTSIDIQRKKRITIPIDFIEELQELSADTAEEVFFQNHDRERLLELMRKLSTEDRYLLELRFGEEMPYKEIGALLNISEITARKRQQRALEKLQKLYLKEGYIHV